MQLFIFFYLSIMSRSKKVYLLLKKTSDFICSKPQIMKKGKIMNNSFSGKISVKDFISEIKGCKTVDLKDFKKEIISEEIDEETKSSTTLTKVEGHFSGIMKKTIKPTDRKDTILDLILKELKEIKTRVTNIETDVADIKVRVANIEKCPTIQKELAALS